MIKKCCVLIFPLLAACGGGGNDPDAYKPTVAGAGSTVSSAEVAAAQATIRYAQYQPSPVAMVDPSYQVAAINATVNFDTASKHGSIQFPAFGGTELLSTVDGYATVGWAGPFTYGAYGFQGNVLMACNPGIAPAFNMTQVFISSSLERVKDADPLDALYGLTFDVVDCALLQQGSRDTLTISASGTATLSGAGTASRDTMINMFNPEKWGGGMFDSRYYSGHVFRYGSNGVTRHAIVLQTRTWNNTGSVYHYRLATQR